jgi:hypothetical protein
MNYYVSIALLWEDYDALQKKIDDFAVAFRGRIAWSLDQHGTALYSRLQD